MVGSNGNTDFLASRVVCVAGKYPLQLIAGRQLQAIQRRSAKKSLADDERLESAFRRIDDVIRTQQDIHRAASRHGVGAVAANDAQFGLYCLRVNQLAADEIPLAYETRHEGCKRLMVQVERRVPLFQPTILEHADLIADSEGFFLIVGDENGAGATRLENFANFVAQAPAQVAIEVGERLV